MMRMMMRMMAVLVVLMLSWSRTLGHPGPHPGDSISAAYQEVQQSLGLKEEKVMTSIFDPVLRIMSSLEAQHDKVLVKNATLVVYLRIMSQVLKGPQGLPGLEGLKGHAALLDLQKELQRLQRQYYHRNQDHTLQTALNHLDSIQVDDPLVQRQALAEFLMVRHAVSSLGSRKCNHTSPPV